MSGLGVNKFDNAATDYDDVFTNSRIGVAQRRRVWHFLKPELSTKKTINILELNCGTGEDALFFTRYGHKVTATDSSEGMLKIAKSKDTSKAIHFFQMDLNNIDQFEHQTTYDLIFSNFGGLNCIDAHSLEQVVKKVKTLLNPNGRFIAVVMPSFCIWETCYFLVKLKFSKAFRRRRMAVANVAGTPVNTWYYSPEKIKKLANNQLRWVTSKPIGLFVPPSYLEKFFNRHVKVLGLLENMEGIIAKFTWQAAFSDHYYIKFERR